VPVSITELDASWRERRDTGDIGAQRERELHVIVDEFQRDEVVPLVVASVVEQHAAVMLRRREPATDATARASKHHHQHRSRYYVDRVCNKRIQTVQCPSVRPSVCPSQGQRQ